LEVSSGQTIAQSGGSSFTITTPQLNVLNSGATSISAASQLSITAPSGANLLVVGPSGSSTTVSTTNTGTTSAIGITGTGAQTIAFGSSGGSASTLSFTTGGTTTARLNISTGTTGSITINNLATVSTNNRLTVSSPTISLLNQGGNSLVSTGTSTAGQMTITSPYTRRGAVPTPPYRPALHLVPALPSILPMPIKISPSLSVAVALAHSI
jgi:hypothetical protein